jgi:hypothetical protein
VSACLAGHQVAIAVLDLEHTQEVKPMKATGALASVLVAVACRHIPTIDRVVLDFTLWLASDQVKILDPKGQAKLVPFASLWLKSTQATRCDTTTFDPKWNAVAHPNIFNFFRGN